MKVSTLLRDRPWIWIIVAFLVLIASWVALFRIAKEHAPEPIRIQAAELPDHVDS